MQVNQVKVKFAAKGTQCTLVEESSPDFLKRIFFCCRHLPGHLESLFDFMRCIILNVKLAAITMLEAVYGNGWVFNL